MRVRAGRNWRGLGAGVVFGKEVFDVGLGHVAAEGVFEIVLEVAWRHKLTKTISPFFSKLPAILAGMTHEKTNYLSARTSDSRAHYGGLGRVDCPDLRHIER